MKTICTEIMSKTHCAREFEISRQKLNELIDKDLIPIIEISGKDFINCSNYAKLERIILDSYVGKGNNPRNGFYKITEDEMTRKMRLHDEKRI